MDDMEKVNSRLEAEGWESVYCPVELKTVRSETVGLYRKGNEHKVLIKKRDGGYELVPLTAGQKKLFDLAGRAA